MNLSRFPEESAVEVGGQKVPILKSRLAGEQVITALTHRDPALQAPLTEAWGLCQAALCQQTAAVPLVDRGVAMLQRLAGLLTHSDALQAALLFPLVEAEVISQTAVAAQCSPTTTQIIHGVMQMAVSRARNPVPSPLTTLQLNKRRRMLLAMIRDVRCVILKLIERIVYLGVIKHHDHALQQGVASECQQLYAPLANCLGIGQLKWELEDLAWRALHPQDYRWLASQLQERRRDREQKVVALVHELQILLAPAGFTAQISGRPKHLYSIWQKLQNKPKPLEQLFDARALRIIVEGVPACYAVLSLLHTHYRSLLAEFADYITHPKPNGYQSIHTVLLDSVGEPMEIQIRTPSMHQAAELGIAAHWQYKEARSAAEEVRSQPRILWLRQLLAWQTALTTTGMPQPLLEDRWIYLFTPQGEVVELPLGATPVDFAYAIHTEIGHRCIGAKVEGRIVPLTHRLQMGEQITILTQKTAHPRRDWLNPHCGFVTTRRARGKIRAWLDQQDRLLGLRNSRNPLNNRALIPKNNPERPGSKRAAAPSTLSLPEQNSLSPGSTPAGQPGRVRVAGVDNILVTFARCCNPTRGDRIKGFITQGRGVSIHQIECHRLSDLQSRMPERLISVQWYNGMLHSNTT